MGIFIECPRCDELIPEVERLKKIILALENEIRELKEGIEDHSCYPRDSIDL